MTRLVVLLAALSFTVASVPAPAAARNAKHTRKHARITVKWRTTTSGLGGTALASPTPSLTCPAGFAVASQLPPLAGCLKPGSTKFAPAETVACPVGYGVVAASFLGARSVPVYMCRVFTA